MGASDASEANPSVSATLASLSGLDKWLVAAAGIAAFRRSSTQQATQTRRSNAAVAYHAITPRPSDLQEVDLQHPRLCSSPAPARAPKDAARRDGRASHPR